MTLVAVCLAALMLAGAAGGFLLLAMGRLHLDLGWGRSIHPLGPTEVRIEAPRELVFEVLSAPYVGRSSGGDEIEVIAGDGAVVVAAHFTKVHFYTARTVEVIELEPPARMGFRHLTGPVPHAVEAFELAEEEGATTLLYTGEIGIDWWFLGRLAARSWVRPQWEGTVSAHLDDVKARAERRAASRRSREGEAG